MHCEKSGDILARVVCMRQIHVVGGRCWGGHCCDKFVVGIVVFAALRDNIIYLEV